MGIHKTRNLTKHASFNDFWDVWKNVDWSIVFLRITVTLFKDRNDTCQFKDKRKFRLKKNSITKDGMKKICEDISIFLNNSWRDIWVLTNFCACKFPHPILMGFSISVRYFVRDCMSKFMDPRAQITTKFYSIKFFLRFKLGNWDQSLSYWKITLHPSLLVSTPAAVGRLN